MKQVIFVGMLFKFQKKSPDAFLENQFRLRDYHNLPVEFPPILEQIRSQGLVSVVNKNVKSLNLRPN